MATRNSRLILILGVLLSMTFVGCSDSTDGDGDGKDFRSLQSLSIPASSTESESLSIDSREPSAAHDDCGAELCSNVEVDTQ